MIFHPLLKGFQNKLFVLQLHRNEISLQFYMIIMHMNVINFINKNKYGFTM